MSSIDNLPAGFSEQWFVSWRNLENAKDPTFRFHDVTLRDGEQQAGVMFTGDEKIAIATALAELGIDRIEGGMLAVSEEDRNTLKRLVQMNLGPEIWGITRSMREDVEQAISVGVHGVGIILLANDQYCRVFGWSPEDALKKAIDSALQARDAGLQTTLLIADSSRMTQDRLQMMVEGATQSGHYDALALMDTFGALNPAGTRALVSATRKISNLEIEFHAHNDFGLGTANTLAALEAGAGVIHTSVLGLGERVGNASLEEVAMATSVLQNRPSHLQLQHLKKLTELVQRSARVSVSENKAITGSSYHRIESGGVATEYQRLKQAGEPVQWLFPFDPALVGSKDIELVLGKGSGVANVNAALSEAGLILDSSGTRILLEQIKRTAIERHDLLSRKDLVHMAVVLGARERS